MLELELQSLSLESYVSALCSLMPQDTVVIAKQAEILKSVETHDSDVIAFSPLELELGLDHDLNVMAVDYLDSFKGQSV